MRSLLSGRVHAGALAVCLCLAAIQAAFAVSVTITAPISGQRYAQGSVVSGSGAFSWGNENSVDMILLYTLTGSSNTQLGTSIDSQWANITSKNNVPNGVGGSGTWQTSSTVELNAPTSQNNFYFTAVPYNAAQGPFTTQGDPYYFQSVELSVK